MAAILVVGFLVVMSASSADATRRGALRVYQGEEDMLNEFPFAVILQKAQRPFNRFCSGSLIARDWVLTAGHCIRSGAPMVIKYGEYTLPANESKSYARVLKLILHPGYAKVMTGGSRSDIALILIEKVHGKPLGKLLALDYKSLYGLPVKYAGFGVTKKKIFHFTLTDIIELNSQSLKVGEGVVIPCETLVNKYGPAVCIVPKCSNKKQQARPGDSGGPLIYNGSIIGVSNSLGETNSMSYYAPIGPFLSWITKTIELNRN